MTGRAQECQSRGIVSIHEKPKTSNNFFVKKKQNKSQNKNSIEAATGAATSWLRDRRRLLGK